jgi:prefoldin subunit 5
MVTERAKTDGRIEDLEGKIDKMDRNMQAMSETMAAIVQKLEKAD